MPLVRRNSMAIAIRNSYNDAVYDAPSPPLPPPAIPPLAATIASTPTNQRLLFTQEQIFLRKRAVFTFPLPAMEKTDRVPKVSSKNSLSMLIFADNQLLRRVALYQKLSSQPHKRYEKYRAAELRVRAAQRNLLTAMYACKMEMAPVFTSRDYRLNLSVEEQSMLSGCYNESVIFQAAIISQGFQLYFLSEEDHNKLHGAAVQLYSAFQVARVTLRKFALQSHLDVQRKASSSSTSSPLMSNLQPRRRHSLNVISVFSRFRSRNYNDMLGTEIPVMSRNRSFSGESNPPVNNLLLSSSTVQSYPSIVVQVMADFDEAWCIFESQLLMCSRSGCHDVNMVFQTQLVTVMMSEALEMALHKRYVTRSMVEDVDPELMLAIPRFAIMLGLLEPGSLWSSLLLDSDPQSMFFSIHDTLVSVQVLLSNVTLAGRHHLALRLFDVATTSSASNIAIDETLEWTDLDGCGASLIHSAFVGICAMADRMHSDDHARTLVAVLTMVFAMYNASSDARAVAGATSIGDEPLTHPPVDDTCVDIVKKKDIMQQLSQNSVEMNEQNINCSESDELKKNMKDQTNEQDLPLYCRSSCSSDISNRIQYNKKSSSIGECVNMTLSRSQSLNTNDISVDMTQISLAFGDLNIGSMV